MSEENNKNLDGVKKLDKKKLEESRKIVLDTIGDDLAEEAKKDQPAAKIVDSVIKTPPPISEAKVAKEKKPSSAQVNEWKEKWRDAVSPTEESPAKAEPQPHESDAPKEPETEESEIKKEVEAHPEKKPEKKKEEKYKAMKPARTAHKPRMSRKKHAKKYRPIVPKNVDSQSRHRKKKTTAMEKIKNFIAAVKDLCTSSIVLAWQAIKKIIKFIVTITFFIVFFYIILVMFVNILSLDYNLLRMVGRVVPIPAAISANTYIDYFQFIDIKNNLQNDSESENNLSGKVLETIFYNDMIRRYGLEKSSPEEARQKLQKLIIFDPDVNKVGLARIKNIDKLIKEEGDFSYQIKQQGDDADIIELTANASSNIKFAPEARELSKGEISDIIYTDDGYYILKCLEKTIAKQIVEFIYVQGSSLSDYLNNKIQNENFLFLSK